MSHGPWHCGIAAATRYLCDDHAICVEGGAAPITSRTSISDPDRRPSLGRREPHVHWSVLPSDGGFGVQRKGRVGVATRAAPVAQPDSPLRRSPLKFFSLQHLATFLQPPPRTLADSAQAPHYSLLSSLLARLATFYSYQQQKRVALPPSLWEEGILSLDIQNPDTCFRRLPVSRAVVAAHWWRAGEVRAAS